MSQWTQGSGSKEGGQRYDEIMAFSSPPHFYIKCPDIRHWAHTVPDKLKGLNAYKVSGGLDMWSRDIHEGLTKVLAKGRPSHIDTRGQCFPKWGPGKGSSRITWGLIKNANSWAHLRPTESETLGPSNLHFDKPSRCF